MKTILLSSLRLLGSIMVVSFGLIAIFVWNFDQGGSFKFPSYLAFGMTLAVAGGIICLLAFLTNRNKAYLKPFLSFIGVVVVLSGFITHWLLFSHWYWITSLIEAHWFVPGLGSSLTSLGILIMFTASVVQFRILPRMLFVLVPSVLGILGYSALIITKNVLYISIFHYLDINFGIWLSFVSILSLIFFGSVTCVVKTLSKKKTDILSK